jgi:hypothetical protein
LLIQDLQKQIAELIQENQRGTNALFEAERLLAEAEYNLDTVEQKAYIKAQGTVADRTALARLEAAEHRLERDLRRAELNRIKHKVKSIETALMALGTQVKLLGVEAR